LGESKWDEAIILDNSHLSGFTGGDPDFECQVLDIFLANAPNYLEALCATNQVDWKSTAHKLKGAARSIGAWRLARAAERAEHLGSPATGDPRRTEIIKILAERLADLVGYIKNHQKALRG